MQTVEVSLPSSLTILIFRPVSVVFIKLRFHVVDLSNFLYLKAGELDHDVRKLALVIL